MQKQFVRLAAKILPLWSEWRGLVHQPLARWLYLCLPAWGSFWGSSARPGTSADPHRAVSNRPPYGREREKNKLVIVSAFRPQSMMTVHSQRMLTKVTFSDRALIWGAEGMPSLDLMISNCALSVEFSCRVYDKRNNIKWLRMYSSEEFQSKHQLEGGGQWRQQQIVKLMH